MVVRRRTMLLLAALLPFAAGAEPFAYVVVGAPIDALRVIDTKTNLDARPPIALPSEPLGPVALSPNGKRLYALTTLGRALAVDTITAGVSTVQGLGGATGMALGPDGRRLYQASVRGRSVTDLLTGQSTSWPPVSWFVTYDPEVAVGPDGQAYWTECAVGMVCALFAGDATTFAENWHVNVGADRAAGVAVSPDGEFVYVSATISPHYPWAKIQKISTASRSLVGTLDLGIYGLQAGRIALSPDGRRLYAVNGSSPSVTVVDAEALTILKNIPLDVGTIATNRPMGGIAVTPDGKSVYVTNGELGTVSVLDTATMAVTQTLGGFGRADSSGAFIGPVPMDSAVEYYNATLDHHFMTATYTEIYALDAGAVVGWVRTGQTFAVYAQQNRGASPVCRYYIPPTWGDSHFYSASPAECDEVRAKFPMLEFEAPDVFYTDLPDLASGKCPPGSTSVYRLWNNRADSNHRYTTSVAIRQAMIAKGYVPEGYGPAAVAMCAP